MWHKLLYIVGIITHLIIIEFDCSKTTSEFYTSWPNQIFVKLNPIFCIIICLKIKNTGHNEPLNIYLTLFMFPNIEIFCKISNIDFFY